MIRDYTDYAEESVTTSEEKDVGVFRDLPLKIELSFKSRQQLKREVWDNARKHGWLPE